MRITNLRQDFKQKSYLYYCDNRDDDTPIGGIVRIADNYYFINNNASYRIRECDTFRFVPNDFFHYVNTNVYRPSTSNVKEILSSLGKHLFTKDVKGFNYVIKRSKELMKTDFSSPKYRRNYIYEGIHDYHYSHGTIFNEPLIQEKDYKIGVELEVECKNESCYNEVKKIKSNWFQMEKDASLDRDTGIEFVTIPLNPKDAKRITFWKRLITYLNDKANSWDSSRCGLHCHIGREILGSTTDEQEKTLTKLLYLYHHILSERLHDCIYGRRYGFRSASGKTEYGDACAIIGTSILKDNNINARLEIAMKQKNSENRYFDINILNINTIEFRKGKGSLNANRICSIVEYCEMMCLYCRKTKINKLSERGFLDFINKHTSKNSPLREKIENCF